MEENMPMPKRALIVAASLMLWSGPAFALTAKARTEAPGTPQQVWALAADFCSIKTWHPSIAACTTSTEDGALVRHLTLTGGGTIVEKQTAKGALSYSYEIVSSPLPVKNYSAKLWVEPDDEPDRTAIYWAANFDANGASDEDAVKTISGILQAGVAGIKQLALKAADEREGKTYMPPKVEGGD
jgi:Polyketide cyclase / dehydrase and lipid transport